jgi:hypothetical protein
MCFPIWRKIAGAVLLAAAISGCGFTTAFTNSFDSGFRSSCLSGAMKNGASKEVAEKYCECALVKFKETRSMDAAAKACVPR